MIILPGELRIIRRGGVDDSVRVFVVDYTSHGSWSALTCVLRDWVPPDVSWTGSRSPGFVFSADTDDVTVDLAAVEAGQLP